MRNTIEIKLSLGEQIKLKGPVFGKSVHICYAGQCNPNVYSIAVLTTFGNNSSAYNLYFNEDQREIRVLDNVLKIIIADAGRIEFTCTRT